MTERVNNLNKQFSQRYPAAGLLRGEWFKEYTIKFAQPINVTTEQGIRRLIEQGVREGWSVPTTQKRLKLMFEQWMTGKLTAEEFQWFADRLPDYRLERIVRTETMRALNSATYELYKAWGVKRHEWVATMVRTRPDHVDADGQIADVGKPFNVGGYPMLFPGDPTAPPSETINCRCTAVAVF